MEGHTKKKCPQLELTLSTNISLNDVDDDIDLNFDDYIVGSSQLGRIFGDDSSKVIIITFQAYSSYSYYYTLD